MTTIANKLDTVTKVLSAETDYTGARLRVKANNTLVEYNCTVVNATKDVDGVITEGSLTVVDVATLEEGSYRMEFIGEHITGDTLTLTPLGSTYVKKVVPITTISL